MAHDAPAPAPDLGRFRGYLRLIAGLKIDPVLRGRIDPSNVVQQTLLEAHRDFATFRGAGDAQLAAWLRRILARNLCDEVRKRRPELLRERSLEAAVESSSARLVRWLASEEATPVEQAARHEQAVRLAQALDELPGDQQTAVRLKHLAGRSVAEVGREMGRSEAAVAGLLRRGLNRLRQLMAEQP
jgi:RNA polymerase sigma-70 factor (ECF subfamily)